MYKVIKLSDAACHFRKKISLPRAQGNITKKNGQIYISNNHSGEKWTLTSQHSAVLSVKYQIYEQIFCQSSFAGLT